MDTYMKPTQIAEQLGICYSKALDFIKYSGIKYVKVGRTYLVSKKALDAFLAKNTDISIEMVVDSKYLL